MRVKKTLNRWREENCINGICGGGKQIQSKKRSREEKQRAAPHNNPIISLINDVMKANSVKIACKQLDLSLLMNSVSLLSKWGWARMGESGWEAEREREEGGGGLVHNYSRDLWPEKQFINHSAWANVLQIVLHAAAILVCVKRHNKPGWRTCLGGGGGGAGRKVEIVGGGWKFWGVLNKETEKVFFIIIIINIIWGRVRLCWGVILNWERLRRS